MQSSCECLSKRLIKGIRPDTIVEGADAMQVQKKDWSIRRNMSHNILFETLVQMDNLELCTWETKHNGWSGAGEGAAAGEWSQWKIFASVKLLPVWVCYQVSGGELGAAEPMV